MNMYSMEQVRAEGDSFAHIEDPRAYGPRTFCDRLTTGLVEPAPPGESSPRPCLACIGERRQARDERFTLTEPFDHERFEARVNRQLYRTAADVSLGEPQSRPGGRTMPVTRRMRDGTTRTHQVHFGYDLNPMDPEFRWEATKSILTDVLEWMMSERRRTGQPVRERPDAYDIAIMERELADNRHDTASR